MIISATPGRNIIWKIDPLNIKKTAAAIDLYDAINSLISGIAYDKYDNKYYIKAYASIISIDVDLNKLQYSFSVVHTETGQGFEFHKGYAYVAAYEAGIGCPNKRQMYCNGQEKTAKIYVYNAKYNSDGKL